MRNGTLFIVHLGLSGFPRGLAEIQKQKLLSKALLGARAKVTVISRRGIHEPHLRDVIPPTGCAEGITYLFASGSSIREDQFLKRNILKLVGLFNEFRFLWSMARHRELDAAIVSSMSAVDIMYYNFLALILGFRFILNYVELNSSMKGRENICLRFNDMIFDRFAAKIADAVLPISNVLMAHAQNVSPGKPMLKVPALTGVAAFDIDRRPDREVYFLLCAAIGYIEIILFSLRAFERVYDKHPKVFLYLVVNGPTEAVQQLRNEIAGSRACQNIRAYSNLSDEELLQKYVDAVGLLIPLRPTLQDRARFPQKIAEYAATGNPIITTNYGEVRNYFVDRQSALIAGEYDVNQFAERMLFVLEHPLQAEAIGAAGRKVAEQEFDYHVYGERIRTLITNLQAS